MIPKAHPRDIPGRFREIISDPLNLLIERVPEAGMVHEEFVTLHNGLRVPISGPGSYYGDFSVILALNRGVHEPLEEFVFQEMLRVAPEAPVMLELGAYWAHYSMWLKKLRPRARAIMVEPEAENLAVGVSNFERSGMMGEFHQGYVAKGRFEVDPFMKQQQIHHLDILHSDIQGFEVDMLDGAAALLARRAPSYVFVSTHSQDRHRAVIDRLTAHAYRVEVSADFDHDTTSSDGLVFATSPSVPALFSGFITLGREKICAASPRTLVDYIAAQLSRPSARP